MRPICVHSPNEGTIRGKPVGQQHDSRLASLFPELSSPNLTDGICLHPEFLRHLASPTVFDNLQGFVVLPYGNQQVDIVPEETNQVIAKRNAGIGSIDIGSFALNR